MPEGTAGTATTSSYVMPVLEPAEPSVAGEDPAVLTFVEGLRTLLDLVVVAPEQRAFWLFLAVTTLAVGWFLTRWSRNRSQRSRVRRWAGGIAGLMRGLSLLSIGVVILSLVPAWLAPAILLAAAAASAALGWSLRDVLPDLVAAVWLVVERRIQVGASIVGGEDEGVVERLGIRSSWMRTPDGRRKIVPNRKLLQQSFRVEPNRWPRVRVSVLLDENLEPERVRRALVHAVLSSHLVPVEPMVRVERSPEGDARWFVATRLVDLSFRARFQGELLERVESMLDARVDPPSNVSR
ncbi:MAG: mechanosensitive ion channel domain-containing protein [Myxococcota bacterium]